MKRIILHWSAGAHGASDLDRRHYHYVIEGSGRVVEGQFRPEDNESTRDGHYAAHTLNCNSGAIGVAVAAMAGAKERPFDHGAFPITPIQVEALVRLVAKLCAKYDIPVHRETVLSHAEVQPTLKIAQRGKWDITWLPGMEKPDDPVKVGDFLRAKIAGHMAAPPPRPDVEPPAPIFPRPGKSPAGTGLIAAVLAVIAAIAAWFSR